MSEGPYSEELIQETASDIQNYLELTSSLVPLEFEDYQKLRDRLVIVISEMLDDDFNRLLNLLYRMDVSEEKVKRAFVPGQPGSISEDLADLVLQREIQKILTRRKYKDPE